MAGHSKWANIKHRKSAQDSKRGKIFTKIIKEITVASKLEGADPDSNPRLRKAITNAKSKNIPAQKISRAIKKGSGEMGDVSYEDCSYEGFGPGGVAIIIDTITDNKNRTVSDIRHIFSKFGGNLAENGSVSWMFEKKGIIVIGKSERTDDDLFNAVLKCGAEDLKMNSQFYSVITDYENLISTNNILLEEGFVSETCEVEMIPKNMHKVSGSDAKNNLDLLKTLDDHVDVNQVYSNFDFDDNEIVTK